MGGSYGVQGITLKDLEATPPSEAYKFLEKLGAHMSPDAEIVIMNCSVADELDGKKFIRLMAQITKHKVRAWDDWIFVTPSGQEWIAKPDGTREAGKLYPPFRGTPLYYLWTSQDAAKYRSKEEKIETKEATDAL